MDIEKEIIEFILKNSLSPFSSSKTEMQKIDSIFKTRDAKAIHNKVLSRVSSFFNFLEKPNGKRGRAQSFGEDAKGDGEPSNAFLSEPI